MVLQMFALLTGKGRHKLRSLLAILRSLYSLFSLPILFCDGQNKLVLLKDTNWMLKLIHFLIANNKLNHHIVDLHTTYIVIKEWANNWQSNNPEFAGALARPITPYKL